MEKEGIAGIIAIEKEIQGRIEGERIKAGEWLEDLMKKAEEDLARAEDEIKRNYEERLSAFEQDARDNAAKIIEKAMRWSERMKNLREDELKVVLLRFIIRIIPVRPPKNCKS